jgi:ATP-dependent exoDNAse (exonuclease V) beta subunit
MDFGTKVHEVLEMLDFNNPDEYLNALDQNIKEKIIYFLNTPLIKENINSKLYKEYEFTYLENNTYSHGIIDLLIEREDKMIIIDYKLKNINDEAYDKQLNGYRKVIKEKTNKEVECYLYSIMDSTFRKVEE